MKELKIDSVDGLSSNPALHIPVGFRIVMLLSNFMPLLLLVLCVITALAVPGPYFATRGVVFCAVLYLLPPLACRVVFLIASKPLGEYPFVSRQFLVWWLSYQLQVIFNRLPLLEELLRLIPGLYSLWLRLWGARIGKLTFWSPGARVLDRPYVTIGDFVVVGLGCRLCGHEVNIHPTNRQLSFLADEVTVGSYAMLGGYSVLMPGVVVEPGAATRRGRITAPYSKVQAS